MIRYIGKRLLTTIPVLLVLSMITFTLSYIAAGDAARILAQKEYASPTQEQIEAARIKHGLDQPFIVQYGRWLKQVLSGDFGKSYQTDKPVTEELFRRYPQTLLVAGLAELMLLLLILPMSIASAVWKTSWIDWLNRILSLVSVSMPTFWIGLLLLYLFGVKLKMVSVITGGTGSLPLLPAFTMMIGSAGIFSRVTRMSMIESINRGYINAARVRGVSEPSIIFRHALKNASVPIVTQACNAMNSFICSSSIVESIFSWNGVGKFALEAVQAKNIPVIQGYVLITALFVVSFNLISDIICSLLDPRMKIYA